MGGGLAECEGLAFGQQPLRAPPNKPYGACEGMRRIWPSHVSKCNCLHLARTLAALFSRNHVTKSTQIDLKLTPRPETGGL
eukprot:SAG25_NODE_371_length_9000_cov_6.528480_1_plen_81_part_00